MLTTFSGQNYKAFKEFNLTIKPLTILLGANSCGKSAIINSLLMLSQTFDSSSISESALRLNASKVGMGETLNIIRDKNPENSLSFSFEFNDARLVRTNLDVLRNDTVEAHFMLTRYLGQAYRTNKELFPDVQRLISQLDEMYVSSERFNIKQLTHISGKVCDLLKLYRKNKESIKRTKFAVSSVQDYLDGVPLKKIQDCFVKLVSLSVNKLSANKIDYKFSYNKKDDVLTIAAVTLTNKNNEIIINISIDKQKKITINSDVIDKALIRNSKRDIVESLNFESLSLSFDSDEITTYGPFRILQRSTNPVATFFFSMINASLKQVEAEISGLNINHVSPLRAFPQRYYLLDKAVHHTHLNALDGTELAEVLKKNPVIKDEINKLLSEFNIAVDVEKVNDIIHKITVNQDAVNLELTDVGFGISQVLPILVQAYLSPKNSITIIEQPEIHLHPKMQAWLTDALIKIALNGDKRFLIETHSDAIVRRIRLRIVDDSYDFNEESVAIYHLERNKLDSCTILNRVPITPDGDITWPSDFMDVEIKDTLLIQQMKMHKNMKSNGVH
jgi:predicted ATPase